MTSIIMTFLLLSLAGAETTSDRFDLTQAIDQAFGRSIGVQQVLNQTILADHQLALAEKSRQFSISLNGAYRYQTDHIEVLFPTVPGMPVTMPQITGPQHFADLALGITQPLLTGGRITSGVALSRLSRSMTEEQARLLKAQTAFEVRSLYITDRMLDSGEKAQLSLQKALDLHHHRLEDLFGAGLASKAELIQNEEKLTELDLNLQEIRRNRQLLDEQFEDLTGLKLSQINPLNREMLPETAELESMINGHPRLRQNDLEKQRSKWQERLATAEYRPQIGLFGEMHGGTPGINMLGTDWGVYGIVGLSARMTLFDFNKKKEQQALRIQMEKQLQFEENRQKQQISARLSMLLHQKEAQEREVQSSRRLIDLADSFLQHQERLWLERQASQTDYLTALEHHNQQIMRFEQLTWQIEKTKAEILLTLAIDKEK